MLYLTIDDAGVMFTVHFWGNNAASLTLKLVPETIGTNHVTAASGCFFL